MHALRDGEKVQEVGDGDEQREEIRRIDAGEAGLPEAGFGDLAAGVDVDEDEAGEDEEEADAEIADADDGLIERRAAGPETDLADVKEDDPECRKEAYGGEGGDVRAALGSGGGQ